MSVTSTLSELKSPTARISELQVDSTASSAPELFRKAWCKPCSLLPGVGGWPLCHLSFSSYWEGVIHAREQQVLAFAVLIIVQAPLALLLQQAESFARFQTKPHHSSHFSF